jgi:hypothetical protein
MLCKIFGFYGGNLKNVFLDVMSSGSCKNRRFGGAYCLCHHGDKNLRARNNVSITSNRNTVIFLPRVLQLLVTANVDPSSPILVTLMETIRSSETSGFTRAYTAFFIVTAVKASNLNASPNAF